VGIEKRRGASVPRGSGLVEEDDGWAAAVSGGGDVQVTMENLRKANLRREKTAKQRRVRRGGGEEEAAEPARRRAATSARGEPGEDKARPKAGKIVIPSAALKKRRRRAGGCWLPRTTFQRGNIGCLYTNLN